MIARRLLYTLLFAGSMLFAFKALMSFVPKYESITTIWQVAALAFVILWSVAMDKGVRAIWKGPNWIEMARSVN